MNPNNPRSTRRPISPAPMRARGTAAAAALAAVLVWTTHTAPAEAALSSVSPGDRIATPDLCTIGYTYTYTGADAHTYALTAGHCASQHLCAIKAPALQGHSSPASSTRPAAAAPITACSTSGPHSSADRHQRPSSRQKSHTAAARPNRLPIRNRHQDF